MKHAFAFSAAALAALLVSGTAQARDAGTGPSGTSRDTSKDSTSTSQSQSGRTTAAPAEKPGMLSMPHRMTGSVVSVDKKANTVNVKDNDGKELTLTADADTAAELSRLKPGDQVKVSYKKNDKDQMVATKITTTAASSGASRTSK
jgi:PDZ domain-containing secreted protein